MKLVPSLLAALVLLALAPVAAASAPPAADLQPADAAVSPAPAESIELDDLFSSEDCATAEPSQAALEGQEPLPLAFQTCGACSEAGCRGARRGQFCGINKHCNIFSGGFMCSTGGWDCQCRAGDLP